MLSYHLSVPILHHCFLTFPTWKWIKSCPNSQHFLVVWEWKRMKSSPHLLPAKTILKENYCSNAFQVFKPYQFWLNFQTRVDVRFSKNTTRILVHVLANLSWCQFIHVSWWSSQPEGLVCQKIHEVCNLYALQKPRSFSLTLNVVDQILTQICPPNAIFS